MKFPEKLFIYISAIIILICIAFGLSTAMEGYYWGAALFFCASFSAGLGVAFFLESRKRADTDFCATGYELDEWARLYGLYPRRFMESDDSLRKRILKAKYKGKNNG